MSKHHGWSRKEGLSSEPMVRMVKPWKGQNEFRRQLEFVENRAKKNPIKGRCRCDFCDQGSANYLLSFQGVQWSGALHHAVLEHNVRPSTQFRNWVYDMYWEIREGIRDERGDHDGDESDADGNSMPPKPEPPSAAQMALEVLKTQLKENLRLEVSSGNIRVWFDGTLITESSIF